MESSSMMWDASMLNQQSVKTKLFIDFNSMKLIYLITNIYLATIKKQANKIAQPTNLNL